MYEIMKLEPKALITVFITKIEQNIAPHYSVRERDKHWLESKHCVHSIVADKTNNSVALPVFGTDGVNGKRSKLLFCVLGSIVIPTCCSTYGHDIALLLCKNTN